MTANTIAIRLRSSRETLVLERLTQQNLNEFREVFKLPGLQGISAREKHSFPGLRSTVYPYQLFASWFMLRNESRLHGGFLADDMEADDVSGNKVPGRKRNASARSSWFESLLVGNKERSVETSRRESRGDFIFVG
jgi:hypothetical protein